MTRQRSRAASSVPGVLSAKVVEVIVDQGEAQAAETFGVSRYRIAKWVKGKVPVPLWAAERAIQILGGVVPPPAPIGDAGAPAAAQGDPAEPPSTREPRSGEGQLLEANWKGRRVMLCLPWYKSVSPSCAFSTLALYDRSTMKLAAMWGDAFISHTRNKLAEAFLASECEWSFWVDDDMILPMGNADWFNQATGFNLDPRFAGLHTLNRLLGHGKTLVGGLYFGRSRAGRPMYYEGAANPQEASYARRGPYDLIKPARWVATGCLLVHRKVFEDINQKFPDLRGQVFSPSEHDLVAHVRQAAELIGNTSVSEPERLARVNQLLQRGLRLSQSNSVTGTGEDVIFCIRASAAGHQPHIDMGVVCGHVGGEVYGPRNTHHGEGLTKL